MSSFSTGSTTTRRASSSKTASTTTRGSSSQTSPSLTQTSPVNTTSSIPTSSIPTTTATVPTQTPEAITSLVPVASSTADANAAQKSSTPVVAIVVVVVLLVLGLISSGVVFFLCRRKKRKQRSAEEAHVVNREPKRQNSYPQLDPTDDDPFARSSKASDDDFKSRVQSVDSALDLTTLAKLRSSRASSSIFVPDDTMTVGSRSTFLRPVSLGEPIGLRSVPVVAWEVPPLPELPLLNTSIDYPVVPRTTSDSSSVFSKDDDRKSTHIVTITRSATPEPILPIPPVPARLPSLAPIPPIRYSLFDDPPRRNSTNTLAAPSQYDDPARPQSMISVYSTPETVRDASETLSPDVQEVLSRLKKRISTPWSIGSVDTGRTRRISVAGASVEG